MKFVVTIFKTCTLNGKTFALRSFKFDAQKLYPLEFKRASLRDTSPIPSK